MNFDLVTAAVFTAFMVVTASVLFLATALSRTYASTGARLWGVAYVLLPVAVLSTVVAAVSTSDWGTLWATGMANGTYVASIGCLLLGFRSYNGQVVQGPAIMVSSLVFLVIASTAVDSFGSGSSAGEVATIVATTVLAAGVAIHALKGSTRDHVWSWVAAAAFVVQALVGGVRVAAALFLGVDSAAFESWFGIQLALVTIATMGMVGMIAIFVLRSILAGERASTDAILETTQVLTERRFIDALSVALRRAAPRTELLVVTAVIIDDVETITASFGREVAEAATSVLRAAVREYASPVGIVGEGTDSMTLLVATTASSPADARRQAGLIYRGVIQRFVADRGIVVPGVGVGVALSQTLGYRAEPLIEGATIAAIQAAESDESSVVFAMLRDLHASPFSGDYD